MATKTFVKPSGMELDVAEASWSHALSLGWIPKESVQKVTEDPEVPDLIELPKKRGRPRKAD